jgi:RNA recognition motif-containing protein
MPVRLFVGNLAYHVTEAEVREHFSAVGPLVSIHFPMERASGRPRGFAFVEFHEPAQAEEAIRRFHNQPFQGRPLAVTHARAREQGPRLRENASAPPALARTDRPRGGTRRQFGPDASPPRQRKPAKRQPHATHSPRRPIPERPGGQFFSVDEDDADGDAGREAHN